MQWQLGSMQLYMFFKALEIHTGNENRTRLWCQIDVDKRAIKRDDRN